MAFTPSGNAPFTALFFNYKGLKASFPDGVNAMLPYKCHKFPTFAPETNWRDPLFKPTNSNNK